MQISEAFSIGIRGAMSYKLRTFLTMLGIIFGVGAVIAMLSIQAGAKRKVLSQIQAMGTKNILAVKTNPPKDEKRFSEGLVFTDAKAVADICSNLRYTAAVETVTVAAIWAKNGKSEDARVFGITPQYKHVYNYAPQYGRFIIDNDVKNYQRVCVLGYRAKRELFGTNEALDQEVKIGNHWFKVVGILPYRSFVGGSLGEEKIRDFNKDIYIPITAICKHMRSPFAIKSIDQIVGQVQNESQIWETADLMERILSRRHRDVTDFRMIIPEALLQQSMAATKTFNIVMGAIAGISLLVGGIGIMNIMLASVLERTREIGIRRAVGATQKDILLQFLVESVMISLSGGIIGIIFGFFLGQGISHYADLPTVTSWLAVVVSFVVSVTVGIVFGIYPARRAALLDPIESLRYE